LAILAETTELLTKTAIINQYTVLPAMFGILILVAPLVGAMMTTIWPHPDGEDQTKVWVYFLAVSIVMWAVAGVFLTMHLFFEEVRIAKSIDASAVLLIQLLLLALGIAATVYTVKKSVRSSGTIIASSNKKTVLMKLMEKAVEAMANDPPATMADDMLNNYDDVDGVKIEVLENLKGDDPNITVLSIVSVLVTLFNTYQPADKTKAITKLLAMQRGLEDLKNNLFPPAEKPQKPSTITGTAKTDLDSIEGEVVPNSSASKTQLVLEGKADTNIELTTAEKTALTTAELVNKLDEMVKAAGEDEAFKKTVIHASDKKMFSFLSTVETEVQDNIAELDLLVSEAQRIAGKASRPGAVNKVYLP
jgi:hypothetical protein